MKVLTWNDVLTTKIKYTWETVRVDLNWHNGSEQEPDREEPGIPDDLRAEFEAWEATGLEVADPDQAWYWTDEWQEGEREADKDISEGQTKKFDSFDNLKRDLLE